MSGDQTEYQSDEERQRAKDLSLQATKPPADVPGYEPQSFLGSGAYGEVWVALNQTTGRRVAIKFYTHRGGLDWSLLSREVEKLVFLSADRYVVQLLDVGWDADPPHYVMEYIENGSLDELLREHGPLPVGEAVELFREVATGLVHAHGKGVLHCDLKPANVLLDQDHRPRLADFGQSRLSHEQKPALGTLFYMAPEQADLDAVPDARWDVYALGALLYCMLTGRPPHRDEELIAQIDSTGDLSDRLARYRAAIRSAPAPTAHRQLRGVDRALADIIDQCLAVDPADRFANVQGVLDALATRDRVRARRPLVALGFVGPALLLTVMVAFGWHGYQKAVSSSDRGVTIKAIESNQFAADFVAETVAHQIDLYFRAVEQVAGDPEFQEVFAQTISDPELAPMIAKLGPMTAEPGDSDPAVDLEAEARRRRQQFIEHTSRAEFQRHMEMVLTDPQHPKAASWFATNDKGTHVGAVFHSPPKSSPVGKYFGWRTYFTGLPKDNEDRHAPAGRHITETRMSAVFQSTATNTWKVAISTPIYRKGQFLGVLAITAEMGEFMEFEGDDKRFAVLVAGREGQNRGAILQHPLFDKILDDPLTTKLPERFGDDKYHVDLDAQFGESISPDQQYVDPLGEDDQGAEYDRKWIAAKAPVRLVRSKTNGTADPADGDTGLVVLVQEDYQSAVDPVHWLGPQLVRLGLLALGIVIAVVTVQWYFVVRLLTEPTRTAARQAVHRTNPTPLHDMNTVGAPRQKRD